MPGSPAGKVVGQLKLRVLPDTSKFAADLKKFAERMERQIRIELPVSIDENHAMSELRALKARLEATAHANPIDIPVDVDGTQATRQLNRISSATSRGTGFLARYGAVIGAVTFAIGALVAALPAMLAIGGFPILAIVAGWDGIKRAVSGLSDEMAHLRKSVSGVFERLLTPGFERLAKLFPVLERGLGKVAEGVSEVFDSFTRSITSTGATKTLAAIFDRVGGMFQTFARLGGMDAFVDSLLKLADAGTKAAAQLTPQFTATFTAFADALGRMSKSGNLAKGMEGIGHAINLIVIAIGTLVITTIAVFAFFERTGEAIATFFSRTIPEGVAAMKTALASDWKSIISGVTGAWSKVKSVTKTAWSLFVTLLKTAWTSAKTAVSTGVTAVLNFIKAIPGKVRGFLSSLPGDLLRIGGDMASGLLNGIRSGWHAVTTWVTNAINKIPAAIRHLLGINSPSRVLATIGRFTVQGFVVGMQSQQKALNRAATKVFNIDPSVGLGSAFNPSFSAGVTASLTSQVGAIVDNTTNSAQEIFINWATGRGVMKDIAQTALAAKEFQARQDALLAGAAA